MADNSKYVRTSEEVRATLHSLKMKTSDSKQFAQILYSTTIEEHSCIKLVEMDDHLLASLEENKCLFFKGGPHDFTVLTSLDRTYELREAETSNTLLLFPTIELSQNISINRDQDAWQAKQTAGGKLLHTYYETLRCQPKLEKILSLLEPSSFKGLAYEKQIDTEYLYDWERLRRNIQSSDHELEEALTRYSVAIIDGYYRVISFEYKAQALTMMLDVMEENSWRLDQVNKEETFNALKQLIPETVFDIIFYEYAKPNDDDKSLYTYDNEKVCRFLAQVLLAASPVNEYKQFMDAWRMGVPLRMFPKPEYLNGVAITKWNSREARKEIISFPASNLPEDINNRLNELFKGYRSSGSCLEKTQVRCKSVFYVKQLINREKL
ncbi:hypothetical protein PV325_008729 [Microctonus aethiopoides]|nr:hypothetical protein PV325_008729 [Microctonus aethiopoides]